MGLVPTTYAHSSTHENKLDYTYILIEMRETYNQHMIKLKLKRDFVYTTIYIHIHISKDTTNFSTSSSHVHMLSKRTIYRLALTKLSLLDQKDMYNN